MPDIQEVKNTLNRLLTLEKSRIDNIKKLMMHCYLNEYHHVPFDESKHIEILDADPPNRLWRVIRYKTEEMDKHRDYRLPNMTTLIKRDYICLL